MNLSIINVKGVLINVRNIDFVSLVVMHDVSNLYAVPMI